MKRNTPMKTIMHPDYWVEIPAGEFLIGLSGEQRQTIRNQIRDQVSYEKFSNLEQQLADSIVTKLQRRAENPSKLTPWTLEEKAIYDQEPFNLIFEVEKLLLSAPRQQAIWLDQFYMTRFPITGRQYASFSRGTSAAELSGSFEGTVANVDIDGAFHLCRELRVRLPTAWEWEKAARGGDGRLYPWGNEWDREACCFYGGQAAWGVPVDAFPKGVSPYGVQNMVGGIPELVVALSSTPYVSWKGRFYQEVSTKLAWLLHMAIWPGQGRRISLRPVLSRWPQQQWTGYRGQETKTGYQSITVKFDGLPREIPGSKQIFLSPQTIDKLVPTAELPVDSKLRIASASIIEDMAWSSKGHQVALARFQKIWLYQAGLSEPHIFDQFRQVVTFSRDDILACLGSGKQILLWDIEKKLVIHSLKAPNRLVRSITFSPTDTLLAVADVRGFITLWNFEADEEYFSKQGHSSSAGKVMFSPDGYLLASGSTDGTVRLWSIPSGDEVIVLEDHTGPVYDVTFSPDGALLASAGADSTVRLWDMNHHETRHILRDPGGNVAANVSFTPDGQMLAVGYSNGMFKVWSMSTGDALTTVQCDMGWVLRVAFSPDGRWLATSSQTVVLWGVPADR